MKCIDKRCYSPLACKGFGYCRERNHDGAATTEAKIQSLRKQEEARAALVPPAYRGGAAE